MPQGASLPERLLCLVTASPPDGPADALLGAIDAAVRGGVNMVQVRAPELPGGELLSFATSASEVVAGRALVIVNDRVDVALAIDADGVQLGERSLPVAAARKAGGDRLLIGRSVHSVDGARRASGDGADFLVLGAIYATASHPGRPGAGVGLVRAAADAVSIPVLGIGGITAGNAEGVVAAGAAGVAVISAILSASDPERPARQLRQAIERGAASWTERAGLRERTA